MRPRLLSVHHDHGRGCRRRGQRQGWRCKPNLAPYTLWDLKRKPTSLRRPRGRTFLHRRWLVENLRLWGQGSRGSRGSRSWRGKGGRKAGRRRLWRWNGPRYGCNCTLRYPPVWSRRRQLEYGRLSLRYCRKRRERPIGVTAAVDRRPAPRLSCCRSASASPCGGDHLGTMASTC